MAADATRTVAAPAVHGRSAWRDPRVRLSTLWIFVTLNYLYCDVLGLMEADSLRGFLEGNVSGMEITPTFLVGAAVLMEIPMAMVLLARFLPLGANRWANIAAGTVMTVVQVGSLFVGSGPAPFYVFFSVIEVATTAYIVWYAGAWTARGTAAAR